MFRAEHHKRREARSKLALRRLYSGCALLVALMSISVNFAAASPQGDSKEPVLKVSSTWQALPADGPAVNGYLLFKLSPGGLRPFKPRRSLDLCVLAEVSENFGGSRMQYFESIASSMKKLANSDVGQVVAFAERTKTYPQRTPAATMDRELKITAGAEPFEPSSGLLGTGSKPLNGLEAAVDALPSPEKGRDRQILWVTENDCHWPSPYEKECLNLARTAGVPISILSIGANPDNRFLRSIASCTDGEYDALPGWDKIFWYLPQQVTRIQNALQTEVSHNNRLTLTVEDGLVLGHVYRLGLNGRELTKSPSASSAASISLGNLHLGETLNIAVEVTFPRRGSGEAFLGKARIDFLLADGSAESTPDMDISMSYLSNIAKPERDHHIKNPLADIQESVTRWKR